MNNINIILLFGVSNVGKSTIGEALGRKLGFKFFDLDDEIKKYYNLTMEDFQKIYFYSNERSKKKGKVLKRIININIKEKIIIAVSPIYYSVNFNYLLKRDNILAIELYDSPLNIFDRLVFSDENDNVYKDDDYKNKHKKYYLKEISKDITYYKRAFSKIEFKYNIEGKLVPDVVDELITIINKRNPK